MNELKTPRDADSLSEELDKLRSADYSHYAAWVTPEMGATIKLPVYPWGIRIGGKGSSTVIISERDISWFHRKMGEWFFGFEYLDWRGKK